MSKSISIDAFRDAVSHVDADTFTTEEDRREALAAARSLCHRLEKPMETMLRIAWTDPGYIACVKVGMDVGLFAALEKGDRSVDELASSTNTDPKLLERVLRLLASMETVAEVGVGSFGPTKLSRSLLQRPVNSAIDFRFLISNPVYQHLPAYLKKRDYENPTELLDSPWQYAVDTKLSFFDYMFADPAILELFTNHMAGYTSQRGTWEEVYPIRERLLGDEDIESMQDLILVDVGGGTGHDLQRFATSIVPTVRRCCLVLQDRPDVIDLAKNSGRLSPTIQAIPIDFTTEAPISGARGYFLHSILHDWPDAEARKILLQMHPTLVQQTADGRKPKLLLNENVLPNRSVPLQAAALDLLMMAAYSAHERSREQWASLLESAGYRITEVFSKAGVDEAVIEAEAVLSSLGTS